MAITIPLTEQTVSSVEQVINGLVSPPTYCTLCQSLKPTIDMDMVFATAFYRQAYVDYALGICVACVIKRHQYDGEMDIHVHDEEAETGSDGMRGAGANVDTKATVEL